MTRWTGSPSSSEVRYLDFETAAILVEAARDIAVELGYPARVPPVPLSSCDEGAIRSALNAPAVGFGGIEAYPEMPAKAAVLLYSLAKSQACIDGNKRLALICTQAFLRLNKMTMSAAAAEIADGIDRVAASDREDREEVLEHLTEWMRSVVRRAP